MPDSVQLKRFSFIAMRKIVIILIWIIWFFGAPYIAYIILEQMLWKSEFGKFPRTYLFVVVTARDGQPAPVSLNEIDFNKSYYGRLHPPESLIGNTIAMRKLTDNFAERYHLNNMVPETASISRLSTGKDGTTYEIKVKTYNKIKWAWRYRVGQDGIYPLEWFEIHDTAGVVLVPLTVICWLVFFFAARKLVKYLNRVFQKIIPEKTAPARS